MRKLLITLVAATAVALVGCVTINVYFPEAAAQKAADQFIGNVLDDSGVARPAEKAPEKVKPQGGGPSASLLDLVIPRAMAADNPDIQIRTPETDAIRERMKNRFGGPLKGLFDNGAVGFTADGLVAVHDANALPLAQRSLVDQENADRNALYKAVAAANGHPEWEPQIRKTFADGWVQRAPSGWYYRDASGAWKRK
jgi:uncharacterized protein YdbL (DUF1318 family)